jgi:cyanophycin synthetase
MGHVIEHIALEIQTLGVWTQDLVELARPKHLGPTMFFSYTEENVGPQNQPMRRILNRGTEYGDLQKMREIRERVRLGPAWKKQVEKDPDPIEPGFITIGAWINQMRFRYILQTSR